MRSCYTSPWSQRQRDQLFPKHCQNTSVASLSLSLCEFIIASCDSFSISLDKQRPGSPFRLRNRNCSKTIGWLESWGGGGGAGVLVSG